MHFIIGSAPARPLAPGKIPDASFFQLAVLRSLVHSASRRSRRRSRRRQRRRASSIAACRAASAAAALRLAPPRSRSGASTCSRNLPARPVRMPVRSGSAAPPPPRASPAFHFGARAVHVRQRRRRLPKRASSSSSCVRRHSSTFCRGKWKGHGLTIAAFRTARPGGPAARRVAPAAPVSPRMASVSQMVLPQKIAAARGRSRMLASSPGFDPAT